MKNNEENIKKIEEILVAAYWMKNNFTVSKEWQKGVMKHIRQLSVEKTRANDSRIFGKIIWRFAIATSLSAVILLLYAIRIDVIHEGLIADLFTNDPLIFIVAQTIIP